MNTRARRNKDFTTWEELKHLIELLDPLVLPVLARVTEDANLHMPVKIKRKDPEWGAGQTHYHDPTGEAAMNYRVAESVAVSVDAMAEHVLYALNTARVILAIAPSDVGERAKRSIPDCLACGDPCPGKMRGGFDDKCYTRWLREGRPDRFKFISETKNRLREEIDVPPT